jgi:hypothetical protein
MGSDRRAFLRTAAPAGAAGFAVPRPAGAADGPARPWPGAFDVRAYRAAGDGKTLDTAAIQAAVDAAHAAGGGTVYFPAGTYLSGTVALKSNVFLHLPAGATLLGSPNPADYPAKPFPARDLDVGGFCVWALVYAENATNVGVEGHGTIDGNGKPFPKVRVPNPDVPTAPRPRTVFFKDCKGVTLRDVTFREAGIWAVHLAVCDDLVLSGLRVSSTLHLNQDGIVLDSCRNGVVSDCLVDSVDDAVVIKSSFPRPSENLTVTNCVLRSFCAALKLGTQSLGGFRNIAVSNCAFHDCRLGGLKFQAVDGGDLEDVTVSNVVMTNVAAPISVRLGDRGFDFGFKGVTRPRPVARLRNVSVRGVRAAVVPGEGLRAGHPVPRAGQTMSIAGIPGHPVEGVTLADIDITFPGGGTAAEAARADVPERERAYPEHDMFGALPAYGLYVRHATGVTLDRVRFGLATPDHRPAVVCDDVADLYVTGLRAAGPASGPLVRLRRARGATLRDCRPAGGAEAFVRLEGADTSDVALVGNDLRRAGAGVVRADGFAGPVAEAGNLRAAAD